MTFEQSDYITIYCPACGRRVGKHHIASRMNKYLKCRNCKKEVVYDCVSMETYIGELRKRTSSSGLVF